MKRIVIIGAGPSGLTAGLELVNRGYAVTILEATDAIGGISRTWVPRTSLPEASAGLIDRAGSDNENSITKQNRPPVSRQAGRR